MRNPQRVFFSAAAVLAGTLAIGLQTGTAWAAGNGHGNFGQPAADQPPGNNGTVKIDEYSMDPGQDDDPHVSCDFSVSFYAYDGGPQTATITVTPVAPTAGGHSYSASTSWNVGNRTSGSQFDRNVTVTGSDLASALAGVTPQAQQGYHLRLEVEVTGSQGSDDKYKVFWLQPCGPLTASGSGSGSGTDSGSGSGSGPGSGSGSGTLSQGSTSGTGSGSGTPSQGATATGGTISAGDSLSPETPAPASVPASSHAVGSAPAVGAAVPAAASRAASVGAAPAGNGYRSGGFLAFTGFDLVGMSAAGLGLIGAGTFIILRQRRKDRLPAGQI